MGLIGNTIFVIIEEHDYWYSSFWCGIYTVSTTCTILPLFLNSITFKLSIMLPNKYYQGSIILCFTRFILFYKDLLLFCFTWNNLFQQVLFEQEAQE